MTVLLLVLVRTTVLMEGLILGTGHSAGWCTINPPCKLLLSHPLSTAVRSHQACKHLHVTTTCLHHGFHQASADHKPTLLRPIAPVTNGPRPSQLIVVRWSCWEDVSQPVDLTRNQPSSHPSAQLIIQLLTWQGISHPILHRIYLHNITVTHK